MTRTNPLPPFWCSFTPDGGWDQRRAFRSPRRLSLVRPLGLGQGWVTVVCASGVSAVLVRQTGRKSGTICFHHWDWHATKPASFCERG